MAQDKRIEARVERNRRQAQVSRVSVWCQGTEQRHEAQTQTRLCAVGKRLRKGNYVGEDKGAKGIDHQSADAKTVPALERSTDQAPALPDHDERKE